jgi:hypothetical protein
MGLISRTMNKKQPAITTTAKISVSVAGQTRHTQLAPPSLSAKNDSSPSAMVVIAAPLCHLYHSQLYLQVELPSTSGGGGSGYTYYRASYSLDQLPIHQETRLEIPLQPRQDALVGASSSNPQTAPPELLEDLHLVLHLTLDGPCRSEIVKAHQVLQTWFQLVDKVEDILQDVYQKMSPPIPALAKKRETILVVLSALLVGFLVPVATVCVAISPLVIGFCILFFPILIPLVVGISLVIVISLVATLLITSAVYASTRSGRRTVAHWWQQQSTLQQYWNILTGPRFGLQTFYYATGPRPTPVTLVRTQMPKEKWRRLGVSLTLDGVGSCSYLLPIVGEAFDVVWAPTQTVFIMALYQHVSPNMSYVSFAEEMLPFLDVLPSATTGWMMEFGPELWDDAKMYWKVNGGATGSMNDVKALLWGTGTVATSSTAADRVHPSTTTSSTSRRVRGVPPSSTAAARPSRHA